MARPTLAEARFFVDENALGLARSLVPARRDVVHPGHRLLLPDVPLGTLDTDWLPVVGRLSLVVISRDKRIRTKPANLAAFRAAEARAFWIAGEKDLGTWATLVRIVRRWDSIEDVIATRGKGPWFYAITDGGLSEIALPA